MIIIWTIPVRSQKKLRQVDEKVKAKKQSLQKKFELIFTLNQENLRKISGRRKKETVKIRRKKEQ